MCQCEHPHDDHDPAGFCKPCNRTCGVDRRSTSPSPLQRLRDALLSQGPAQRQGEQAEALARLRQSLPQLFKREES